MRMHGVAAVLWFRPIGMSLHADECKAHPDDVQQDVIVLLHPAGAYAINPVVERASSAQHLQLASGCPPAAYWAGSLAWDMTSHLAVTLLSLAIFAAYGDQAAVGSADQVNLTVRRVRGSVTAGCVALCVQPAAEHSSGAASAKSCVAKPFLMLTSVGGP